MNVAGVLPPRTHLILLCERCKLFTCVIKLFQRCFGSNWHILVPRVVFSVDIFSSRTRIHDTTCHVVVNWLRLFDLRIGTHQVLIAVALSLLVLKESQRGGLADAPLALLQEALNIIVPFLF